MEESLLSLCNQFGTPTEYENGAMIHNRGDLKPGLSIVLAGQVKVGNYGVDGNYQLTTVMERGDTFGEFTLYASLARTHHAQAMSDCNVLQINESRFRKLEVAHPEVGVFLTRNLAIKLHATLERLDDILRLPTHVQLAKLIYQTSAAQDLVKVNALFPGPYVVDTGLFNSDRVSPAELDKGDANDSGIKSVDDMREMMEQFGMELKTTHPDEVAQTALQGLRNEQFWISPMNEDTEAKIKSRMDSIFNRTNPVAPSLG